MSSAALLHDLRQRIRRLERADALAEPGARKPLPLALPLGFPEIDAALPEGGLPRGELHDIAAAPGSEGTSAAGFAAMLLARLAGKDGVVVWCRRGRDLYGPGLAGLGLDPARVVVVRAGRTAELLWAMEESLRGGAPAAVLCEIAGDIAPVAARRLQLAAGRSGVTALLLRPGGTLLSLPATTRWRVLAAASAPDGHPRWRVELLRCRGGTDGPRSWLVAHEERWKEGIPAQRGAAASS